MKKIPVILSVLIAVVVVSCRTAREITVDEIRPVSTGKLLKEVERNAFDYKYFSVKKVNCQFSNNKEKANFRINLKSEKDKRILVSISKLNIPVGRVLLTPDSVKYVNYIDRNYFLDDYTFLSGFLNIDLDFETIQSIISNNAFSYRNDQNDRDFKSFDAFTEEGMHVLQSEKNRKIMKLVSGKEDKVKRHLRRMGDEALILQKMYFNPVSFALTKLIINDKTNNRLMEMIFEDFVKVMDKDYPGRINMRFDSPSDQVSLNIRMSGFSTDEPGSINLNVPGNYEQIVVN